MDATAMRRAMARIIYELETIREEGFNREGGLAWYAGDRMGAIAAVARLAADGDANACLHGIDVDDPAFFDQDALDIRYLTIPLD